MTIDSAKKVFVLLATHFKNSLAKLEVRKHEKEELERLSAKVEPSSMLKFRKKKAKGPNPLSCKKKGSV